MTDKQRTISKGATHRLALSIVIPVYNGSRSVGELVRALDKLPL